MDLRMKYRSLRVLLHLLPSTLSEVLQEALELRLPLGALPASSRKAAHSLQAGGVEGFQDVEGGEQERAGAAGGVEDRHVAHGVPEGAQELRSLRSG